MRFSQALSSQPSLHISPRSERTARSVLFAPIERNLLRALGRVQVGGAIHTNAASSQYTQNHSFIAGSRAIRVSVYSVFQSKRYTFALRCVRQRRSLARHVGGETSFGHESALECALCDHRGCSTDRLRRKMPYQSSPHADHSPRRLCVRSGERRRHSVPTGCARRKFRFVRAC